MNFTLMQNTCFFSNIDRNLGPQISIDFFDNSFKQIKLIELIRQISTGILIVI